ncbi:hypothetical protein [Shewanella algae]|uniref:hypothetical protein n=1 Tax=Shewanella algae TaxID=38313 RepID=UPI003005A767
MTDVPLLGVNSLFLVGFAVYYAFVEKVKFIFICSFLLSLFSLNALFSGNMELNFSISSFIQFMCSIFVFLGIRYFLLNEVEAKTIVKFFNVSLFIVSLAILLQCFSLDFGIFEVIRKIVLPTVYSNSDMFERDALINISGTIRPTLISKESSFISVYVFLSVACLFMMEKKKNYINYFFALIICVLFNTSPLIIWVFMLLAIPYIYSLHKLKTSRLIIYSIFLCLSFYMLIPILFFRIENATGIPVNFYNVLDVAASGVIPVESSLSVRLINPFITTIDVLSSNLLFGSGFGNADYILSHSRIDSEKINVVLNNGFAAGLTYLGALGFLLLLFFLSKLIKLNFPFFIFTVAIVFFAGGGFTTMRLWAMLAVFTVAFELYRGNKKGNSNV